jgi:protein-S-isoprenylcysteine O-methyltransferase Ste14
MRLALYHPAAPATAGRNLAKTALQCTAIWGVTLGVLPLAIRTVEQALGVPGFAVPGQVPLALTGFVAFSALNLWTGSVLVRLGHGTPLPLDCPRELVVRGPYAYVRNPMAVAGLGQGGMVALGMGSWGVLAYVAVGIALWQWGARPSEERDLAARFGTSYAEYQRSVRCWWPRTAPFRPEDRRDCT